MLCCPNSNQVLSSFFDPVLPSLCTRSPRWKICFYVLVHCFPRKSRSRFTFITYKITTVESLFLYICILFLEKIQFLFYIYYVQDHPGWKSAFKHSYIVPRENPDNVLPSLQDQHGGKFVFIYSYIVSREIPVFVLPLLFTRSSPALPILFDLLFQPTQF